MDKDQCFHLGYVSKLFGFKGEVVVFIDADNPENYTALESVFLEIKGKLIPFFIERVILKSKSNQVVFRFQDIDSEEKASQLIGAALFLPLSFLPKLTGNAFYYHEVEGYQVIDQEKGPIGSLVQIISHTSNPLFQIQMGDREILIPVVDDFIERLDRESQTLYLKAPQGLIDIYLSDESPDEQADE